MAKTLELVIKALDRYKDKIITKEDFKRELINSGAVSPGILEGLKTTYWFMRARAGIFAGYTPGTWKDIIYRLEYARENELIPKIIVK
jgi:hypothetical protein